MSWFKIVSANVSSTLAVTAHALITVTNVLLQHTLVKIYFLLCNIFEPGLFSLFLFLCLQDIAVDIRIQCIRHFFHATFQKFDLLSQTHLQIWNKSHLQARVYALYSTSLMSTCRAPLNWTAFLSSHSPEATKNWTFRQLSHWRRVYRGWCCSYTFPVRCRHFWNTTLWVVFIILLTNWMRAALTTWRSFRWKVGCSAITTVMTLSVTWLGLSGY